MVRSTLDRYHLTRRHQRGLIPPLILGKPGSHAPPVAQGPVFFFYPHCQQSGAIAIGSPPVGFDIRESKSPIDRVLGKYTKAPRVRVEAMAASLAYLDENKIEGDVVECGVW